MDEDVWDVRYKRLTRIGEGAHGVVYKAEVLEQKKEDGDRHGKKRKQPSDIDEPLSATAEVVAEEQEKKTEKKIVAIKKIRLRNSKEGLSMEAIREIKLLQELDHPHILKISDVFVHDANINLVLEFMRSDLETIIRATDRLVLKPGDIKQYMTMLLSAVQHCHANWVLHRDIKPGNLLIDLEGNVKLADFGLAKIYGSPDRELSNQACTIWYRAPELLFGSKSYGPASDMWSVGCVFAELLLRQPIFPGNGGELDQLRRIISVMGSPTEENWPGVTSLSAYCEFTATKGAPFKEVFPAVAKDGVDLISGLLRYDPSKRLSATDALTHPYFTTAPPPTPVNKLPTLEKKVVLPASEADGGEKPTR